MKNTVPFLVYGKIAPGWIKRDKAKLWMPEAECTASSCFFSPRPIFYPLFINKDTIAYYNKSSDCFNVVQFWDFGL